MTMVRWWANSRDLEVLERLELKKGLDRSSIQRLALYHLAEFEGLGMQVEAKTNLQNSRAVESA